MTRARFGLLLALLALVVAGAAFAVGLAVLDDDEPDPPPAAVDTGDTLAPDPAAASSTTTPAPVSGEWIVVIASEATEAEADAVAADVVAGGHPADVLRSDDYPSLNPGFWVVFAGPYPDRGTAEAAVAELGGDGVAGTYARCAGTEAACGG